MEPSADYCGSFGASSKHFDRRLLTIGENRLELLMLEAQEERERLLYAVLLAHGVAVFRFLADVATIRGSVLPIFRLALLLAG
jgi:uncharacterized membrane protein YqjE